MAISTVRAALRLSRVPSCVVAFLTVFVPIYTHTRDLSRSLAVSVPIVVITMCTFILNDLNDLDSDRVNHPERPLPAGLISPQVAAIIYLAALALFLAIVWVLTEPTLHYWYLAIFLLAINYNTVVAYLPEIKTFYVASTITFSLAFVILIIDARLDIGLLASAFLFILGRELLMDVQDLEGDGHTLAKWLTPAKATLLAFGFQGVSAFMLLFIARAALETAAASTIAVLLFVVVSEWWKESRRRYLLQLMHVQMVAGIAFLI